MSARSCIGVALGAVVLGSILVSVSADAQPAQAPVNQPACTVSTASLCRQRCDSGATANYGGARACDELGRMYRDGTPGVAGGVGQANPAEATPLFTRSCYLGWSAGCLDLAVGYLKTGDSTLEPKARQAYEGGCLSGGGPHVQACYGYAEMCEAGRGGPKDIAAAKAAYQRACDGGDTRGCNAAKRLDPSSQKAPAPPQAPGTPTSTPAPPRSAPAPTAGGAGRVR